MHLQLQPQSLSSPFLLFPTNPSHFSPKVLIFPHKKNPSFITKHTFKTLKCSLSTVSEQTQLGFSSSSSSSSSSSASYTKPFPAEVSRTIMELSSQGTLSTLSHDGWPLGIGVRFAVDPDGTPVLCLDETNRMFSVDRRSSLHVQLEQCGLRTPQCTVQGSLIKPEDTTLLNRLQTSWTKRFGEEVGNDLLYYIAVDRVLQIPDFKEDGIWVTSSEYKSANPDPLRDFAERFVDEINTNNMEDIYRFCNVYVDLEFQVSEVKMIWVDRLGFDVRIYSPEKGIVEVRIPFPREVTDEKGAKSSFNGMSQQAWEVEKNFYAPDFQKVKQFKLISH